ncbi:MAG TPA: hypothetical protein VMT11_10450 [Myxococcaceae bacterium]|nr:hypothetical protein [Myxococcaceae bacterium]
MHYGVDIGTSPWRPEGGLHAHGEDAALLRQVFERLRADGVHTARFFVLADGRAGIRFAQDGTPEALDGSVFADLDVVLEAARTAGIGLVLVLLDTGWFAPASTIDGQPARGHADAVRDPVKRSALLECVLRPILMRCADHPAIVAWEVLSGADVCVAGLGPAVPERRGVAAALRRWLGLGSSPAEVPSPVTFEEMRAFLCDAVTLVRRHTRALATVAVSRWSSLALVRGVGLDVYSVGWPADEAELRRAVSDLRLDRPLLLNSFPGNHPRRSIKTMLDTARCAGYGGAFVWSVLRHDIASGYDGQVSQWARNHAGQLNRRDVVVPAPESPPEPREQSAEAPASPPIALQR